LTFEDIQAAGLDAAAIIAERGPPERNRRGPGNRPSGLRQNDPDQRRRSTAEKNGAWQDGFLIEVAAIAIIVLSVAVLAFRWVFHLGRTMKAGVRRG